jgi:holo-[acyl-carrier protein] synthase
VAVVGVGIDAVEITRLQTAVSRTPTLMQRLFTEAEQHGCVAGDGALRHAGLAARFAAKEAVAKAMGTGVSGFAWRDIEVTNDDRGAPHAALHQGAAARAKAMGGDRLHLSLSTTGTTAVASAVLESVAV